MRALPILFLLIACTEEEAKPRLPLDARLTPGQARAGVIENERELIGGIGARGRVGDLKIYNDRIAVILGQLGTAIGFHPYGGIVLDADRVRAGAGQSVFGEVVIGLDFEVLRAEEITVVSDGSDGPAQIRVSGVEGPLPLFEALVGSLFESSPHDLAWDVDYILEPDQDHLRIEHTFFNRGHETIELAPLAGFFFGTGAKPFLPGYGFSSSNSGGSSDYYGAVGPAVSYLYARQDPGEVAVMFGESGLAVSMLGDAIELRAREKKTITDYLVVGDANLSLTQDKLRTLTDGPKSIEVTGRVIDTSGAPVANARVHVTEVDPAVSERDYVTRAPVDAEGRFQLLLPPGSYLLQASTDTPLVSEPVEVSSAREVELQLAQPGVLRYTIKDDRGTSLPAKISVAGSDVSVLPGRYGEPDRAPNLTTVIFAHTGEGEAQLPPGDYALYVSRGGEYEIATASVTISATTVAVFDAVLSRSVDTTGWLSSDPHIHARLSPDSPDSYLLKVRAMAAENLELPVSTDHEAIGDFNPAIEALGLSAWMKGIIGTEITTTSYGHFNAFPLLQDFAKPGNGRIDWYLKSPAEMLALARASNDPFIQVNHPRSASSGYFSMQDFDRATFSAKDSFSTDFDGIEVINGCGDGSMERAEVLDWFAFLNRGLRKSATGATDDHHAGRGNMGYPLTYVQLEGEPSAVQLSDVRDAYREGRLIVSCGPFVELTGTHRIGDLMTADTDRITLDARVAAPTWMDVDVLRVVVDGVVTEELPLATGQAERFNGTITTSIAPGRDGWVILWAAGDTSHGVWAQHRPSFAFTNPIFIDGNGDGRWTIQR